MKIKSNNFRQISIKQVISVILMMLLTFTVIFPQGMTNAATTPQEADASECTKVYFDNSNAKWSSVNAYIWTPESVSATCLEMTLVNGESNIYECDIPVKYQKLLFKNTAGTSSWNIQSNDLYVPTGSLNCYKPNSSSNKSSGSWVEYEEPIKELTLSSITSDKQSPQAIGTSVQFIANAKNVSGEAAYKYKINGQEVSSTGAKLVWTPSEIGEYQIEAIVTDSTGKSASKIITYTIKDISKNQTTIFYKGYSNAYIHYRIGNGSWTSAPGVKMETSSELDGYTHKIVIDLNDADTLTACFNNGSGSWDSNGSKNYTFKSGTYTFSNGTIKEIVDQVKDIAIKSFDASSSSPQLLGTDISLSASIEGGNGNVVYTFTEICDNCENVIYEGANNRVAWTPKKAGNYTLKVFVKDAKNKTAEKTINYVINNKISIDSFKTDVQAPQYTNTQVKLTTSIINATGEVNYKFYVVDEEGTETSIYEGTDNNTLWTPNKSGKYTLKVVVTDESANSDTSSIDYVINDKLSIDSFECTNGLKVSTNTEATFNAVVSGGIGTITYTFTDKDGNVLQQGESSKLTTIFNTVSDNIITVIAKDELGTTETKSTAITVYEGFKFGNFTATSEYGVPRVFGTTTAGVDVITGGVGKLTYKSYITSKNTGEVYGTSDDLKASYKFSKAILAGEYTFTVEVTDEEGTTESKSYDFEIYPTLQREVTAEPMIDDWYNTVPLNSDILIKLNLKNQQNKVYITFMDENMKVLKEGYDNTYTFNTKELGKTWLRIKFHEEGSKYTTYTGITIDAVDQEFTMDDLIIDDKKIGVEQTICATAQGNGAPYTFNTTVYNSDNEIVYTDKQTCASKYMTSYTPDKTGEYRVVVEASNLQGVKHTKECTFRVGDLKLIDCGTKQVSPQPVNSEIELFMKAESLGMGGNCNFRVVDPNSFYVLDQSIKLVDGYASIKFTPKEKGTYYLDYMAYNTVCQERKIIPFEVGETVKATLDHFNVSTTAAKVGQEVKFDALAKGDGLTFDYNISVVDENNKEVFNSSDNITSWTPDKAGNYTANLKVVSSNGQELNDTKNITVSEIPKNTTTIYYKGYSNAYIHYKIGNGSWTSAPGVKMETTSEMAGFTHKIVINSGEADKITACFNNGYGSWDSNGGKNYTFGLGEYTFSSGVITDITDRDFELSSFTASKSSISLGNSVTLNALAKYGAGNYKYKFTSVKDGVETIISDYSSNASVIFTPDAIGDYTLMVYAKDADGKELNKETTLSVTDVSKNIVTIYYSGYSNPYIHYKIGNGSWTPAPGVKMEATSELSGYSYKMTIDLGDADKLTACFNNGSGSWDSNGGRNYTFKAGTYTFKSGVITEINK